MSRNWNSTMGFITPTLQALLEGWVFKDEGVSSHLPFLRGRRDDVILTKRGDLFASAILDGVDSFTCEGNETVSKANDFAKLIAQLGERFGFYVNKITLPTKFKAQEFEDDSFAKSIDEAWRKDIAKRQLKRRVFLLTVAVKPSLRSKFGGTKMAAAFKADVEARIELLDDAMRLLEGSFDGIGFRRLSLSDGEWLGYLTATLGQTFSKNYPVPGRVLAGTMTNFDVSFNGRTFTIDDGMNKRFGTILGVKSYPPRTWTRMMDSLELPYDVVLTNSFTPIRNNEAEEVIKRNARQMGATEDAAASLREELFDAADNVASGRQVFGKHHMSILVTADTEKELSDAAAEVWRAGQESGATLVRWGQFVARAAYFSNAPANWAYRVPTALISADNFARLSAFHATSAGRPPEKSPWGENITMLPTVSSGQYRFNFHEPGNKMAEPSAGHTLVLGRPGSGKTLGTAFLVAQALRVHPRVIVFDKDQGLEMAVRAMGGAFSSIRVGQPTGFNPFLTETDDRGAAWLTDWLADILARHKPLDTAQTVGLTEAVRQIVRAEPELRNFTGLKSLLSSTDDDGDLVSRVDEWTAEGRYGWLFDRETDSPVEIGEDVVGVDMTEILDMGTERSALLAYLFRRIERVIEDRRPTFIVIDEAWKMLNDDIFVKRLHDWLVTMRKKNCVVMMLTQTPGHLAESSVGGIIAETVNTQILFPNANSHPEDYKILRVNEREGAFLSTSTGGMRLALVRSAGESVFVDFDLGGLGGFLTVLGGGRTGEDRAPFDWRNKPDFWKEMV